MANVHTIAIHRLRSETATARAKDSLEMGNECPSFPSKDCHPEMLGACL